jgi:hypothetical protein
MLSQMLGKYNIDMITSNIVNMGNTLMTKGQLNMRGVNYRGF